MKDESQSLGLLSALPLSDFHSASFSQPPVISPEERRRRQRPDEARRTSFKTIVAELTPEWALSRADTLAALNSRNVLARAYYHPPLHAKPMAYPHIPATLPRTDALAERFLLLPCGHHVSAADVHAICDLLRSLGQ